MNTKRLIALALAVVWLILSLLTDDDIGALVVLATANIWLAAALLAGGRK